MKDLKKFAGSILFRKYKVRITFAELAVCVLLIDPATGVIKLPVYPNT
jgi:hypothetical protein